MGEDCLYAVLSLQLSFLFLLFWLFNVSQSLQIPFVPILSSTYFLLTIDFFFLIKHISCFSKVDRIDVTDGDRIANKVCIHSRSKIGSHFFPPLSNGNFVF